MKNEQSVCYQYCITKLIDINLRFMNTSINLHHQPGFVTIEIDDKSPYYMLPTEM